jgi:hypothetical protein
MPSPRESEYAIFAIAVPKIDAFLASRDKSEPSFGADVRPENTDEDQLPVDHDYSSVDASHIVPSSYMTLLHATSTTHNNK